MKLGHFLVPIFVAGMVESVSFDFLDAKAMKPAQFPRSRLQFKLENTNMDTASFEFCRLYVIDRERLLLIEVNHVKCTKI